MHLTNGPKLHLMDCTDLCFLHANHPNYPIPLQSITMLHLSRLDRVKAKKKILKFRNKNKNCKLNSK